MTIEDRVKKAIGKQFGLDPKNIGNDQSFVKDLGGDSLDTIELVLEIEDEFGIEVLEEAAEEIYTVQDVINYVTSVLPS